MRAKCANSGDKIAISGEKQAKSVRKTADTGATFFQGAEETITCAKRAKKVAKSRRKVREKDAQSDW